MKTKFFSALLCAMCIGFMGCKGNDPSINDWTTSGTIGDYSYVDLGLSVYWATLNIGANEMTDNGHYYAWAETQPKKIYKWYNLSYCNATTRDSIIWNTSFTKYTQNGLILDTIDDAAAINWGNGWRTPTIDEWAELLSNCTWKYTKVNNIEGAKITSNVANYTNMSIFLPFSGFRCRDTLIIEQNDCVSGHYWSSSSLYHYQYAGDAKYVFFEKPEGENIPLGWTINVKSTHYMSRANGCTVRPVHKK